MRAGAASALLCAAAMLGAQGARGECVATAPTGAGAPEVDEAFPPRGTSGYASTLRVTLSHGRGETVLPRGLELQGESEAARALKAAGFVIPEQDAGAGARLESIDLDPKAGRRQTTLDLPLLLLPPEPGRHTLVLPALPIAIARASGDVVTVCTKAHSVVVDDPTASTPDAKPRPNPLPRAQREEWTALKRGLAWSALGVSLGLLLAWLVLLWRRRPRPVRPPPPPRPAWDVALERLDEVRHAGLLDTSRFSDFFDRVNDTVREYLGARFGFDGLESTTDETLTALRRLPHFGLPLPQLAVFLQQCDLVKFADLTPTLEECQVALDEAERVVRATMPAAAQPPAVTAGGGSREGARP